MKKIIVNIKIIVVTFIVLSPYTVMAKVAKVSCGYEGNNFLLDFPKKIPSLTSKAFLILEIVVPIVIIIFGSIDLVKAIAAGKEDEIKKAQGILIKRLITGVIVFFVFAIVKLLVNVVEKNSNGIVSCMNCFINNTCEYVKKK